MIPLDAFRPEPSETTTTENTAETIKVSTLINSYVCDEQVKGKISPRIWRFFIKITLQEKKPKLSGLKPGTLKMDFKGSISYFNFEPIVDDRSSSTYSKTIHVKSFHVTKLIQKYNECFSALGQR